MRLPACVSCPTHLDKPFLPTLPFPPFGNTCVPFTHIFSYPPPASFTVFPASATMVKTPRPWKRPRSSRTSSMTVRFGRDGRSSWANKMAQREERAALVAASAARAAAHGAAAKAERERRKAKRERKEANRLRSSKTQTVRLCAAPAHEGCGGEEKCWRGERRGREFQDWA